MYDQTNFIESTEATWQILEAGPQRKPDYVSLKKLTFKEAMCWLFAVNGSKMPNQSLVLENVPAITDAHKAVKIGDLVHFAVPDVDSYEDDPCAPWEKIGIVLNVGQIVDNEPLPWEKDDKEETYFGAECQEVSSAYWYNEQGVYRLSDHWGDVGTCRWSKSNFYQGRYAIGFCRWDGFKRIDSQESAKLVEKFNNTKTSRKA